MDYATFISNFPEFTDQTAYPQGQVNFYLGIAVQQLNSARWGASLDYGLQLYTAHCLVLARQRAKSAATGAVPGVGQGVVNSKAIDKVSVGYDTAVVALENGGLWNSTTYGIQFLQLARMIGSGGLQISGCAVGFGIAPDGSVFS